MFPTTKDSEEAYKPCVEFALNLFSSLYKYPKEDYIKKIEQIVENLRQIGKEVNSTKKGVGKERVWDELDSISQEIKWLLRDYSKEIRVSQDDNIELEFKYLMPVVYEYFKDKKICDLEQIMEKANDDMKKTLEDYMKERPVNKSDKSLDEIFGIKDKREKRIFDLKMLIQKLALVEWELGPSITSDSEYPSYPFHIYRDMKWDFFTNDLILVNDNKELIDRELNEIYVLAKWKILECIHPKLAEKVRKNAPPEYADLLNSQIQENERKDIESVVEAKPKGGNMSQQFRRSYQCKPIINQKTNREDDIPKQDKTQDEEQTIN